MSNALPAHAATAVNATPDATLLDVVNHYNTQFNLELTSPQKSDLIEYLKML